MSDNDGIDDALRNAAQRTAGMLARLGEAQSRATQQHAIDREHAVTAASTRADQQARQAAAQEEVATTRLRLVHEPNWWASATIGQVGDTWQIADAYRGHHDANAAREIMTREITTRWGVTPAGDADSAAVRRLLEQAENRQSRPQSPDRKRPRLPARLRHLPEPRAAFLHRAAGDHHCLQPQLSGVLRRLRRQGLFPASRRTDTAPELDS